MKIIFKFLLLFFAFSLQAQSFDIGIGFLPNKVKAGGKTLFAIDFRYINTAAGGPAITLQSPVTINLPAGVTVVSGGQRGYNLASGVWGTTPIITTTSNTITVATGASINDANDSTRGTNGYIWVEVQVNNAATVNLAANTVAFQSSTGISYTNATADSASVSIAYTANPDVTTTACQPLNIGILLDNSGSMDVSERQDIVDGIKGMLDDLQAFYASGNITTPYRVSISKFSAGATAYEELINLTDVTGANRASIDAALDGYLNYVNLSTNWTAGLSGMTINDLDLLFFFTDGTPNSPSTPTLESNNPNDFVRGIMDSYDVATAIKNAGVHLFTITNNDQVYFTSSMDETPATPFGAYLTRAAITGEDSQVYTNDFRTQDYFTGSFSAIKTFFDSSANTICTTIPSTTVSGFVFNDFNGNLILEAGELFMDDIPPGYLYVYLVNASGIVVDSASVQPNGSYTLTANQNQNYTIELSTTVYPLGTNVNVTPINNTPPAGFVTVGENGNNNTGSGDGDPNGVLSVSVGTTPITNQNFAIQEEPVIEAIDDSSTVCVNGLTGGNTNFNVMTNDLAFGSPVNPALMIITSTPTAYLTVNPNGSVTVAPNTPTGTYTIDYTICFGSGRQAAPNDLKNKKGPNADLEFLADDFCDTATVTVCVVSPNNNPETNPVTHVLPSSPVGDVCLDGLGAPLMNGSDIEDGTYSGNSGTVNQPTGVIITSLPTYGELWYYGFGFPVVVTESDILNSTIFPDPSLFCIVFTGSGFSSDTFQYSYVDSTGAADSTPADYTISWTNEIIAVNDTASAPVNGTTGGNAGLNVYDNDTLNGNPATPSNVTLTSTPTAQLSIDPVTGAVTVAPGTAAGTYTIDYTICETANISNCDTATVTVTVITQLQLEPFPCSRFAYQVTAGSGNSSLYQYDVLTGTQTLISNLSSIVNAIGYYTTENLIVGYDRNNNKVIRIGANGNTESFTVPNLPNVSFNVGAVFQTDYLFLYITSSNRYYVVDVNPTSANYMQLVDPTNGFSLETANFGTTVTPLSLSDIAYDFTSGNLIGMIDPGAGNQFRIVTLNPLTGSTSLSAPVSGAGIQGETSAYGSQFSDLNNNFYVFTNTLGRFYKVDLDTFQATLLSNSVPTGSNDGTNCPSVSYLLITANDDVAPDTVDGVTGGDSGIDVYANDTVNSVPATPSNVTLTFTPTPELTIDPATGAVTVTPGTPAGTYSIGYTICDVANPTSCDDAIATVTVTGPMEPFICNSFVYQVFSSGGNSTLYQYDINNGDRNIVANYPATLNGIGYDPVGNLIVGYDINNHKVVRLDASGTMQTFTIPNLPNVSLNVGTVIDSNYLFLYLTASNRYYVVDINSSSSNFMQLVDPTNGYILESSDFGTVISSPLSVSDIAYNLTTGNLVGLIDPGTGNQYRVATLNPTTGTVTINSAQVSGGGILGESSAFGSQFTDLNSDFLYVFANNLNRFYSINLSTLEATLLSTPPAATGGNDGANCPGVNFMTEADLSITKVVDNANPFVGDTITFTITATNNGPDDSENTVVTESIPTGYTVVSVTPSTGTWAAPLWTIGDLANGTSATLTVVVTVNANGNFTNTVSITGDLTDPVLSNNSDTVTPNVCRAGRGQVNLNGNTLINN